MTDRNCKNCACYTEVMLMPTHPPQPQCRRNPPLQAQVRMETPRVLDNKPVIGKDGKPVMNVETVNMFLHAPTAPDKVCFDGWRPLGILPGRRHDRAFPPSPPDEVLDNMS